MRPRGASSSRKPASLKGSSAICSGLRFTRSCAFGKKYAPGVTRNLEHAFALKLLQRVPVTLSEHLQYRWMSATEAIATASSSSDRAVIRQLRH